MVKNPPANAGDTGLIPGRQDLWRRKWQPTPVFLPGTSHGERSLAGYSPWGHKVSYETEQLNSTEQRSCTGWTSRRKGGGISITLSTEGRWTLSPWPLTSEHCEPSDRPFIRSSYVRNCDPMFSSVFLKKKKKKNKTLSPSFRCLVLLA